jgi:hypothetical protein
MEADYRRKAHITQGEFIDKKIYWKIEGINCSQ